MRFQYFMPTKILFGKGQLGKLHKQKLPGKKAMIVISSGGSVKKYGYLARLQEQLDKAGVSSIIFDKILPNPILAHVMEGAELAKKEQCDFMIGLGGGSSMDSAKAIAIMATNEGDYWDYVTSGTGKGLPIPNEPLPIIAITTTAGTGSEADPWLVTTHEERNEKVGFGYEKTFPMLSIVDPDLMMSVPPRLTAYQGFDALFHSTEGYINKIANVMSDMHALKAIELLGRSLAKAVNVGEDEDARADVALANTLSGIVESTSGCTSEHSMEHALSAFHPKLPHGAGLIMLCEAYYTYFIEKGIATQRFIDMAKALGKKDAQEPMDFVKALQELKVACHVDDLKMSDYGISFDRMEEYAKNAYETMGGLFQVDPIPIPFEDTVEIMKQSFR